MPQRVRLTLMATIAVLAPGCGSANHPAHPGTPGRAPTLMGVRTQVAGITSEISTQLARAAGTPSAQRGRLAPILLAIGDRTGSALDALTRVPPALGSNPSRARAAASLSLVQSSLRVLSEAYSVGAGGVILGREIRALRRAAAQLGRSLNGLK